MKTIDEVIADFEKACDLEQRCENCSGCLGQENGCPNDGAESIPDALFYLKEYRSDKLQWEADKKAYEDDRQKAIRATKKARERYVALAKDTKDELTTLREYWAEQQGNRPLRWVRIDDGRPEQDGSYLTIVRYRDGSTCQKIKLWKDGAFTSEPKQVTHWQPLPPGPEEA